MSKIKRAVTVLCCIVLLQIVAWASYDVAYSGGTVAATGQPSSSYGLLGSGWYGGGATIASAGTASCSGQVTISLTNSGGGERPAALLIKLESAAGWAGDSGSCSNGLGDTPYGGPTGQDVYGFDYIVIEDPDDYEELTVTPSATVQKNGSETIPAECYAKVRATVYVIDLTLTGQNANNRILESQKLTGSVSIGHPEPNPTYAWSIKGGRPFANYTMTTGSAVYSPYSPPASSVSTTSAFLAYHGDVAMECALTLPSIGVSVNLSRSVECVPVELANVSVVLYYWTHVILSGDLAWLTFSHNISDPYDSFVVTCSVKTPNEFLVTEAGAWGFVQTIDDMNLWYQGTNGKYYDEQDNGFVGLDMALPYRGWWAAHTSTPRSAEDMPGLSGINTYSPQAIKVGFMMSLNMYAMYRGPNDAAFIPIIVWDWFCNAVDTKSGGAWTILPNSSGQISVSYPSHPTWSAMMPSPSVPVWIERP